MNFTIDTNNVILSQIDQVESGEYNVTECNFTFSSEFDGLTKKAVFTGEDGTAYLQTIVDNKCSIPSEILETSQVVQIGVYAYAVENEELILRYSPEPTDFFIHEGSYKEAQNSTPPTPSEVEQLQAQITSNKNDIEEIQGDVVDINQDIVDIKAEQITQNENIQTNANNISIINEQISDINETITNLETNKANVTDLNALTERVSTNERDIDTIDGHISDINQNIDDLEQDLTNYSLITETGSQINLNINSSNFQMTAILKDKNGNVIHTSNVIDLPLETMVVGASYDNVTKEVVLTLQNGTTLRFSVADLVSGLVSTEQLTQVLSNYYNKNEVDALIPDLTDYVKNTDYATSSKGGVFKTTTAFATGVSNGLLFADTRTYQQYGSSSGNLFISKGTLENVIAGKELINQTQLEESQAIQDTEIEALQQENAELKQDITNMAKAMYKVDGQGSDITLQNTSENKFVELGINGNTEQEQLSGKNLLDGASPTTTASASSSLDNNIITISSAVTTTIPYCSWEVPVSEGDVVRLNAVIQNSNGRITKQNYDGSAWVGYNERNYIDGSTISSLEYTVASGITKVRFNLYANNVVPSGAVSSNYKNVIVTKNNSNMTYEPYCGGIPAPNSNYIEPIKNVTGNANVKIQNKNLLPFTNQEFTIKGMNFKVVNGKFIVNGTASGEISSVSTEFKEGFSFILDAGTYYLQKTSGISAYIRKYSDNTIIQQNVGTFTITEKTKVFYGIYMASGTTLNNVLNKDQLEQGSTATSYVEHQEQNYPFSLRNKNLFDKNNFEYVNGKRLDDNGNVVSDANSSYSLTLISVKPNTTYTIQGTQSEGTKTTRIYYYNNQKQFISRTRPFGTDSYSFTTLENCYYIGLQLRNSEYINVNIIQLEEGSEATEYEPYYEPYDIKAMQGTQLKDDGIHQKRNQISLIDDYIGSLITLSNGNKAIIINLPSKKRTTGNNIICNKAINNLTFSDGTFYENNTNIVAIGNQNDTLETLKEKYIGSIFEYTLGQEEIIPYNETQQVQYNNIKANASSYDDITIISSESDELGFNMNVVAVADANKVIDNQNSEIDTIKSRLDLLEG